MPKFDPWPVFFKREWNRNWPFLVGFAVTGTIITKLSLGLTGKISFLTISNLLLIYIYIYTVPFTTKFDRQINLPAEEDAKNSAFVQRHKRYATLQSPNPRFHINP
jgi:hypothetical protein